MNVGIIGCGLIGRKRALALQRFTGDTIVVVCSRTHETAQRFAKEFHCRFETDWKKVVAAKDVDVIVNAPINIFLKPITVAALRAGKPVLCEKPLGRNTREAMIMVNAARRHHVTLMTGFNHRFHPSVQQAKKLVEHRAIGTPQVIRAHFGHGGRAGMKREWRSSLTLAGGGVASDLGSHMVDLVGWFCGDIVEASGRTEKKCWNIEVDDNAHAILTTRSGVTASLHASWLHWKNSFSFKIFGTTGYLAIRGLGGSYGPESLEWGRRNMKGGRPTVKTWSYPATDRCWDMQWAEFRSAVLARRQPNGSGVDGLKAQRVVQAIYKSSKIRRVVHIPRLAQGSRL